MGWIEDSFKRGLQSTEVKLSNSLKSISEMKLLCHRKNVILFDYHLVLQARLSHNITIKLSLFVCCSVPPRV